MDYPQLYANAACTEAIRAVPHFRAGAYRDLDINGAIDYFVRRFVRPLAAFTALKTGDRVADIGAGYGWLAIAFALTSPANVIAVDMDEARLGAARDIAGILGVADRIEWRPGALGALPLGAREARVAYCIEVLEHTGRSRPAVRDLARVTDETLVLTTPNLLFPVIAHDTQLPFCHWLPFGLRKRYAALFNRTDRENDNLFWSPTGLARQLPEFEMVSRFLHYRSREEYLASFPVYMPYVGMGMRYRDGRLKSAYYGLAAGLGRASRFVLPSLACTMRRRGG